MSKGFTLIEFVIYIGIVSIVLFFSLNFSWDIIYGNIKTQTLREVQQNGRFALEKVIRSLRENNNPGVFYISNGVLYQEGIALTSDQVEVTNFEINSIGNTYKVKLSIRYVNPGNREEYENTMDLESTVALLPIELPVQSCWGTGGSCDTSCQYSDYGLSTNYYPDIDPGCSGSCLSAGYFYLDPVGPCSNDGSGFCYKMTETSLSRYTSCSQKDGCDFRCTGTCTSCRNLNQSQCSRQQGCYWLGGRCRGTCASCGSFYEQILCQNQLGCSWQTIGWYWALENLREGYPSYINCEWYVKN